MVLLGGGEEVINDLEYYGIDSLVLFVSKEGVFHPILYLNSYNCTILPLTVYLGSK